MKNNSFILLKEEKERIKKLYEATTAAASGSYNQPMGFSAPGLGGDVEVIDMENTFIDGSNVREDYSFLTRILGLVSYYCETVANIPERSYEYENETKILAKIYPTVDK